jgi:asparagine synthase (glutamine-hydrolysing)
MVLAWNASEDSQAAVAANLTLRLKSASDDWAVILSVRGLTVLHAGVRPNRLEAHLLSSDAGAVLGTVFSREADTRISANRKVFDESESAAVLATGGRTLLDRYWGRYVAVIRDQALGRVRVLRDPSGALPCFLTAHEGVSIFFSNVEDCLALDSLSFSLNWKHIATRLAYPFAQTRDTGLNEVTEVQAGECEEIRAGRLMQISLWDPAGIARNGVCEDPQKAALQISQTVRMCVHAWASRHRGVLHNLSGGLDSSIVLSCLADAPGSPEVTCLNYFTRDFEGDERQYARIAAHAKRCVLVEQDLAARSVPLRQILEISRTAKPGSYLYDLEHNRFEAELAAERGATALFTGAGGDALFFQARTELAAADFVRCQGIRAPLIRVAHDAARIERGSIWPILLHAVCSIGRKSPRDQVGDKARRGSLVNREVFDGLGDHSDFDHPWLRGARDLAPGKVWHLLSMGVVPSFYDAFGRPHYPERIFPLMSQPLVELLLRIPSYVLIHGGQDRALARRAFASELPEQIIRRRVKGGTDTHLRRVLKAHIGFVSELLLDGALVREGLLNRARLQSHLSDLSQDGPAYNEIMFECLSVEAWIQRWRSATGPSADSAQPLPTNLVAPES